jgi:hypothetical protein
MLGNATFSLIARFDGIGREPSGENLASSRIFHNAPEQVRTSA